ncbi:MAG TPA: helix-turn-helix domain-containing protein [Luteimonas sp.]|nr:helix-turn-helix domain-containing protein [Luteimonas sp.]
MKVTKAQAQANRTRIVETAAQLFRERGYDGVGVAELMAAAGLTHGGFYKHFGSKADLMAEAAASGISQNSAVSSGMNLADFIAHYLSREHRDSLGTGCTIAALSGDAARKPEEVKAKFAVGIENSLAAFHHGESCGKRDRRAEREMMIATFANAVGALVLSRACPDDSPLADEILEVCRKRLLASSPDNAKQEQ